jgi:hypothetical protein
MSTIEESDKEDVSQTVEAPLETYRESTRQNRDALAAKQAEVIIPAEH